MKRVLVTGASGFIGQAAAVALRGHADEIHTVHHKARQMSDSRNHTADLLDPQQVDRLLERVKPTHLLHFAWYAEHGKYWTSPLNLDWVTASLRLFQRFAENGGQRAVFAGTCAEYDWSAPTPVLGYSEEPDRRARHADPANITNVPAQSLNEDASPSNPSTLYGVCKNSLRQIIDKFAAQTGVTVAWGRIFFLYGPGEHPNRLIPSILHPLLNNQPAIVRSGGHVRNLMHVDDVAAAFVHVLNSNITGIVNIAHPQAVTLGDAARLLGELTGKQHLLRIEQAPATKENPLVLTADVGKLTSIGFTPRYSLRDGLSALLSHERT